MSGKFLKSLLVIFSFFSLAFSEEVANREVSVNGYYVMSFSKDVLLGLRSKAIGDMYYNRGNFTKAIKYYEKAIKLLPNEADVYFNLGDIYAENKVYNIAIVYFKKASEKYTLPENYGKTQRNFYLSLIRYAFLLEKMKDYEDNHKRAMEVAGEISRYRGEIESKFPEIIPELNKLYMLIYGTTEVIFPSK